MARRKDAGTGRHGEAGTQHSALSTQHSDHSPLISREEVEHVAYLARVGLSEEEKVRFQGQLSDILHHVAMINQLDTEAIPPTAQVIPLQNVMRPDSPAPCYPPETILANAPRAEDHYFKIPPVLEEEEAALNGPPHI